MPVWPPELASESHPSATPSLTETTERDQQAKALTVRICNTIGKRSRRMLKKFVSKAAADESTGGVASGLR